MSTRFEELDYRPTPMGDLVLRRRREPRLDDREVFEVKLGDEYLMSSLFTEGEIALAELGLAAAPDTPLDVVVGGLGLGYTAAAALKHDRVRSLLVIDAMEGVIDWHRRGLVPLGPELTNDPRCRLVLGDFFALARSGFDETDPEGRFHAVLLDIDHTPRHYLRAENAAFYEPDSLRALTSRLRPGGVFALWSNDPPDEAFRRTLEEVFASAAAREVTFPNPLTESDSSNTVYVAVAK